MDLSRRMYLPLPQHKDKLSDNMKSSSSIPTSQPSSYATQGTMGASGSVPPQTGSRPSNLGVSSLPYPQLNAQQDQSERDTEQMSAANKQQDQGQQTAKQPFRGQQLYVTAIPQTQGNAEQLSQSGQEHPYASNQQLHEMLPHQLQVYQESKKKRGRPKKLILDPVSNQYIDSSHPNFKQLNKLIKESMPEEAQLQTTTPPSWPNEGGEGMSKLYDQPAHMRTLNDQAVRQLMQKKDNRGRPRKFPVEHTGLTIKGVRVNGTVKPPKKKKSVDMDGQKVAKRERGRPRKTLMSSASSSSESAGNYLQSGIAFSHLPPPPLEPLISKYNAGSHSSQSGIHSLPSQQQAGQKSDTVKAINEYAMSRKPNSSFR